MCALSLQSVGLVLVPLDLLHWCHSCKCFDTICRTWNDAPSVHREKWFCAPSFEYATIFMSKIIQHLFWHRNLIFKKKIKFVHFIFEINTRSDSAACIILEWLGAAIYGVKICSSPVFCNAKSTLSTSNLARPQKCDTKIWKKWSWFW